MGRSLAVANQAGQPDSAGLSRTLAFARSGRGLDAELLARAAGAVVSVSAGDPYLFTGPLKASQ